MNAEVVIVAQHPTLPYGFDADGNLLQSQQFDVFGTEWNIVHPNLKKGWRFVKHGGREYGVATLRKECGLPSCHDWDEHEALRQVKLRYCECCGAAKKNKTKGVCMACWHQWRRLRQSMSPQQCDRCGKAYQGHNRRFCSAECRQKAHHERLKVTTVQRICKVCSAEFTTSKWKRSLCCGDECLAAWKALRQQQWVMVEGDCRRCKEQFRRSVPKQHIHTAGNYCGSQCCKRDREVANTRGSRKRMLEQVRSRLGEIGDRDGWVCQLCNEPVDARLGAPDPMCASIDHIIPISRGGTNDECNLQLAHYGCNSRKCNRSMDVGGVGKR